jgi:hypothetical protein
MEQYWAIKTNNQDIIKQWDSGNHPSEEKFKEQIMPLIDQLLKENDTLLKAMMKNKKNLLFRKTDNNKYVRIA